MTRGEVRAPADGRSVVRGGILDRIGRGLARPVPFLLVAAAFPVWVTLRGAKADPDLFARVAVGRLVQATGAVPDADPFAFTTRLARWIDHEWLAGVFFHALAGAGGDPALLSAALLFLLLTVGLVARAARRLGAEGPGALAWTAVALLPTGYVWNSIVRSHVFTWLGVALLLSCLTAWRRHGRSRVFVPLVLYVPVWANAHGGFVTGLGLLGVAATAVLLAEGGKRAAHLWLALAAAAAATLLNPYGVDYWAYILHAVSMPRPTIAEWAAVPPFSVLGLLLLAYAGLFLAAWRRHGGVPPEGLACAAVSLAAAFWAGRLVAAFLLVIAVYGAVPAGRWLAEGWRRSRTLRRFARATALYAAAGSLAVTAVLAGRLAGWRSLRLDYSFYPVEALERLREHRAGGHLLVDFNYGSYALWRLYPRFLVSLDGRYEEVYPQGTVDRVGRALDPDAVDRLELLEELDPDYALVSCARWGTRAFAPGWRDIVTDASFRVLERAPRPARGRPSPRPCRAGEAPGPEDPLAAMWRSRF